jgi:hypothetical protein
VREDPKRKNLLYAGTETGVYFSLDGGTRWQPLQLNLPVVPITDLTIKNNDLIASTQGRAFWVLDDLTPLQERDTVSPTAPYLFTPAETVRARRAGFGRAPAGIGQNPPSGAIVTYWLDRRQDEVTLEFLDATGTVIKAFSSKDRNGPSGNAGLHRFVWDMRYPDAHGVEGGTFLAGGNLRGPVAVPGAYQVRLKAGGHTAVKPLRIVSDPRIETSTADPRQAVGDPRCRQRHPPHARGARGACRPRGRGQARRGPRIGAEGADRSPVRRLRRPDARVRSEIEQPHRGAPGLRVPG